MGAVGQQVYLYKAIGSGLWDTSNPIDLSTFAYDVEVKEGIGNIKDSFSFRLAKGDTYFTSSASKPVDGDLIRIWIKRDSSTFTSSDLKMEGTIKAVEQEISTNTNSLKISGYDFFEMMFDFQVPVSIQQKNWAEAIQILMQEAQMVSRNLIWDPNNPTLKADGTTSFPLFDLAMNYTPFYQIVEKLTSNEYTEDGQYVYFITADASGNRYLSIRSTKDSVLSTIGEGEASTLIQSPTKIKITKSKEDVKNFIVFYAGDDLRGNSIQGLYYDLSSIAKHGFKYHYMVDETGDTAKTILYDEASANSSSFNFSNGKWTDTNHFPTSYNYSWSILLDGASVTSTDNNDFVEDHAALARQQARAIADNYSKNAGKVKYKVTMNYFFRNDLTLGGLYLVNLPSRNISKELRLNEATYTVKGTDYMFEEDYSRADV